MPPFIELGLGDDVKDKECAPEGEYDLVVESVKTNEKEYDDGVKGNVIEIVHAIEGVEPPGYKGIYHYLSIPNSGDDKEKAYSKRAAIKRYLSAAGIPFDANGFAPEDIQGARFTAKVTVETDEHGKYPPQNKLNLPAVK